MKSADIRQAFLKYFEEQGHTSIASSSLVPGNDPTLLFTNAGMVQFKDTFLGQEKRSYTRATSSQRCVRAGGKHNDLENVGYTARHHTFFEMLGNFSFGDYFKREAINYAWTFLTENMGLSKDRLWITVYHEDTEAEAIWLNEVGVSPERFSRLGDKDNFWSMGDTGPCGPCTEIFYDHGEDIFGGPPGTPDEDGDRYIEIWNLVFMQYNRSADGSMVPLPKPSVDTGMGLERIAAILQGVHSNYEIDLFQFLLKAAAALTNTEDHNHNSLKVIADHIRSCSFLISDGVLPSNEGRGYVLRRIIRRAIRHGHQLGMTDTFFYKLVAPLAEVMGEAYPELVSGQKKIEEILKTEEEQFSRTLDKGMIILEQVINSLTDKIIPGETVFKLYDTYGFPVDLTADIAREKELTLDISGFESAMAAQKEMARSASRFETSEALVITLETETVFVGHDSLENAKSTVLALYNNGRSVESLNPGESGVVLLDNTPFYAESGGQVGDTGRLENTENIFSVADTQKQGGQFLHHGALTEGCLRVGDQLNAHVESAPRQATTLNHSATHLMHAALQKVLGEHVSQKGSLVTPEYLRFDFSHNKALSQEEITQVEHLVNEQVLSNIKVANQTMSIDEAKNLGAMALFGEKYGDEVRVVSMGDFSIELCGGTHIQRTGDIGLFKIVQESGIAAGVRRVEAFTGKVALDLVGSTEAKIKKIAGIVKGNADSVVERVQQLNADNKSLEKQVAQLKAKLASSAGDDLESQAETVKGIKLLATVVEGFDSKALRETTDQLKNKLGSAVILLAAINDGKVSLVAGVTKDITDRVKAGDLVNMVAQKVGGKGGGRPDMAMAGGTEPDGLPQAMELVKPYILGLL